ncbi:MAG: SUMF1/EgtB/PvdO family nonheme iron enzyme [FCB group bacterium]|nr:SUMF1/EgtB/PvdO family nonheme iron enzyme [FCB group bacterium]
MLVLTSCAFAQIHIGGNISGVLQDTTYIVDDYLRVLAGDTLIIEPGATLLFAGNYQLQIYGMLISAGTEADSIRFRPQVSTPSWGCIWFDENSSDQSQLSYCYFTGCTLGAINAGGVNITISHCKIEGNTGSWGGGIYLSYADVTISECEITGNSVTSCGGGIYATHSNPQISDCIVSDNHCDGAGSGYGGGGICFNHSSSGTLEHSLISDNTSGHHGGGIACSDVSDAQIINCTVVDNSAELSGGGIEIYSANPDISNNIIAGNTGNCGIHFDNAPSTSLVNCDFNDNEDGDFTGNVPVGLGELVMTNFNGDSCDVFSNIFLDPLFVDTTGEDFNLTAFSPCIDAGNPASPLDPDGTVADIGAYYYDQSQTPPPPPAIDDLTITLYNDDVILDWSDVAGAESYNIYRSSNPYFELSGNLVTSVDEPGWTDNSALNEGLYFYIVTSEGNSQIIEQDFPLGTTGENITMVWIPPGSFMQGAYSGEMCASSNEYPQHEVTLNYGYWIGKYTMTQAQWESIIGENPSSGWGTGDDYPVYYVSWDDIHDELLPTLNSQTPGSPWRLPSESEWEYACRAGTGTRYYWSDDPDYTQINDYAWYMDNSGSMTHESGQKLPNAWGLHDMSGNVWEWCEDWYHSSYNGAPANGDPWLDPAGIYRITRGGGWFAEAEFCRSANRSSLYPYGSDCNLSFRLARLAE